MISVECYSEKRAPRTVNGEFLYQLPVNVEGRESEKVREGKTVETDGASPQRGPVVTTKIQFKRNNLRKTRIEDCTEEILMMEAY